MASSLPAKVLETCRISPPVGTVPPSSTIQLTYFDMLFYGLPPVQRIFFYSIPSSAEPNTKTLISNLKHSLSLTLHRFFPLAGNLIQGATGIPTISCADGDAVCFTVVESDDDFSELVVADHARAASRFRCLVPDLNQQKQLQPVLAVQVTLFMNPNRKLGFGIGIGISTHHGIMDGSSSTHFMKTWSRFYRSTTPLDPPSLVSDDDDDLPFLDRTVIPKSEELLNRVKTRVLDRYSDLIKLLKDQTSDPNAVRSTLVITESHLNKLHHRILQKTSRNCSFWGITCAVVWSCLARTRCYYFGGGGGVIDLNKTEAFAFLSGYRSRTGGGGGEKQIPPNFFGNCLDPCLVELKTVDLVGEDGFVKASVAIADAITEVKATTSPLEKEYIPVMLRVATLLSVAGSPKLGVYEVDFGWGRPDKVELVSIDSTSAMSLAENRDEEDGGFEIGIVLPPPEMKCFISLFRRTIRSPEIGIQ